MPVYESRSASGSAASARKDHDSPCVRHMESRPPADAHRGRAQTVGWADGLSATLVASAGSSRVPLLATGAPSSATGEATGSAMSAPSGST
jgi:hypothetical protein